MSGQERSWPRKRLKLLVGLVLGLVPLTILTGLGQFLVVREEPKPADVIIVLGGGRGERVDYAVQLYHEGYAPKFIMSGGPIAWRTTYAEIIKNQALFLGAPEGDILLQEQSLTTAEDAQYTKEIVLKHGFESAILVTSPYHSRRADRLFRQTFGQQTKVICAPVSGSQYVERWWARDWATRAVVSEYLKLIWHK